MKELLSQRAAYEKLRAFGEKTATTNIATALPPETVHQSNSTTITAKKRPVPTNASPGSAEKRKKPVTVQNFLGIEARKSKQMRSARTAARVGMVKRHNKLSHSGSQMPLNQVVRLKYVKGFTQAVRAPCKLDNL